MLLRPLLSGAQKLVAVTEFEAEFFRERLKLPAEQFTVIPNGAQLDYIPKSREEVTGKTDQGPLIVTIGRLERYKGHQRVIKALPMVREQFPGARIRIVGAGPYEAALRKMASQLDVTEYVEIAAVTTEDRGSMAEILAHANLVTLLSEYESQGIAVMEALALQRPVLVADTSALRQFVDRDLVRAIPLKSSPKEVATAVISQLSQPLVPMKVEWPTWDDCAANLLVLYRAVMRSSA
jgi:glycosyltransferase involved in cell wall biosynthesis